MALPWQKKIPLVGIFSLGAFTIVAAVLNKVYSFSEPFGASWTYWYTRESSTALLVANLPFVWTFWRRIAGIKTVDGLSRQGSGAAGEVSGLTARRDAKHIDSKLNSSATVEDCHAPDSFGALGMEGLPHHASGTHGDMTFADILRETNPTIRSEKEPTPYTHPQLFYSKISAKSVEDQQFHFQKAVLNDKTMRQTLRRGSGPDDDFTDTPTSSFSPSGTRKASTGSFV